MNQQQRRYLQQRINSITNKKCNDFRKAVFSKLDSINFSEITTHRNAETEKIIQEIQAGKYKIEFKPVNRFYGGFLYTQLASLLNKKDRIAIETRMQAAKNKDMEVSKDLNDKCTAYNIQIQFKASELNDYIMLGDVDADIMEKLQEFEALS